MINHLFIVTVILNRSHICGMVIKDEVWGEGVTLVSVTKGCRSNDTVKNVI